MANSKDARAHWKIDNNEEGSRLDRALMRRYPAADRGLIMRLIRKGNIRVNGKRSKPSSHLKCHDLVFIPASLRANPSYRAAPNPTRPCGRHPISIIHEDDALLVIDKPAGVVVHGGSGYSSGLIEWLKSERQLPDLRLAHRLDRDTSGCLVLVKSLPALRKVTAAFRDHQAQKCYFAWVMGHVEDRAGRMRNRLSKGVVRGGERMVVGRAEGREAITDFQVIMYLDHTDCPMTLLALHPHHGRTHQLRVQLQQEGHPIAGDGKYGTAEQLKQFRTAGGKGMALHAWRLRLPHPASGESMEFRAPWPERWASFVPLGDKS